MKYKDIKDFYERCDKHPDHQNGMISYSMIERRLREEIEDLRQYIEQREQSLKKPVAKYSDIVSDGELDPRNKFDAPPQRPWVGLTDEDFQPMVQKAMAYYGYKPEHSTLTSGAGFYELVRNIEAKLKEKNT